MNALISVLPDHVANQIAGEVVQRPASVVNYWRTVLMQVPQITLSSKDAGKTAIVVTMTVVE